MYYKRKDGLRKLAPKDELQAVCSAETMQMVNT